MLKKVMMCVLVAVCFATTAAFAQGQPADSAKAAAPAAAAAAAPAMSPADAITYSKATIMLKGEATVHGAIAFTFSAVGGQEDHITATVLEKSKDKDVAKDVEKEFKSAVGSAFKVSRSGSKVEIKTAKKDGPKFHLSVHSNSANGLSVDVK